MSRFYFVVGEFVVQVALPLNPGRKRTPENEKNTNVPEREIHGNVQCISDVETSLMESKIESHFADLRGPNGLPVVKMFIFLDRGDYALACQDYFANRSGYVSGLDIFHINTEDLPDILPTLQIALLEAGGEPLLSTPNVPHMVITLQHCVMVEQRGLSLLFMDDVTLWLKRCNHWSESPIMYSFITEELLNEDLCRENFIMPLLAILDSDDDNLEAKLRAASSLQSMLLNRDIYAIDMNTRGNIEKRLYNTETTVPTNGSPFDGGLKFDQRYYHTIQHMDKMVREASRPTVYETQGYDDSVQYCGIFHNKGKVRFGPSRGSAEEAMYDRKKRRPIQM